MTARLLSFCCTIVHAAISWSVPGATTGGVSSINELIVASFGRREEPLDREQTAEVTTLAHCNVDRGTERAARERAAYVAGAVRRRRDRGRSG